MLVTLIFGILAGVVAPYAVPHVKSALEAGAPEGAPPLSAAELQLFSFALCLLGAAVLAVIFGSGAGLPLAIGASIGVFGKRIMARIRSRDYPDYDS